MEITAGHLPPMRVHLTSPLAYVLAGTLLLAGCGKPAESESPPASGTGGSSSGGAGGTRSGGASGSGGSTGSGGAAASSGGAAGASPTGSGGSVGTGGAGGGTTAPVDATAPAENDAATPADGGGQPMTGLGPGSPDDSPPLVLPGSTLAFNGKDLTGWMCDPKFWSVKNGAINGKGSGNNFCYTAMDYDTFRITGKSRMVVDPSNHAGICFWGTRKPSGDCLQITPVSGSLWDYGGAPANARALARPFPYTRWAFFEILVDFNKKTVDIAVEGKAHPTFNDRGPPTRRKKGPIGLQLHANPNEVEYKDLAIEANPTVMRLLTAKP